MPAKGARFLVFVSSAGSGGGWQNLDSILSTPEELYLAIDLVLARSGLQAIDVVDLNRDNPQHNFYQFVVDGSQSTDADLCQKIKNNVAEFVSTT